MVLMVNGKEVLGYALGGNEFYSLDNSLDKLRVTGSLRCEYSSDPYSVSVDLDTRLSPDSTLTLRDLIHKGEKIRLIVTLITNRWDPASSFNSDTIDLSKPDSHGNFNFNFQGANKSSLTSSYCSFDRSLDSDDNKFVVHSYAFSVYSGSNYDGSFMQVLYSDWS